MDLKWCDKSQQFCWHTIGTAQTHVRDDVIQSWSVNWLKPRNANNFGQIWNPRIKLPWTCLAKVLHVKWFKSLILQCRLDYKFTFKRYACSLNACYSTLYGGTINVEISRNQSLPWSFVKSLSLHCKTYPICRICWKHGYCNNIETWPPILDTTES